MCHDFTHEKPQESPAQGAFLFPETQDLCKQKTPRSVTSTPGKIALLIQGRKDEVIIA